MAEDDIYNSKRRYLFQKQNLHLLLQRPDEREHSFRRSGKYFCRNRENLEHFNTLFRYMESKDLSFIRRNRLLSILRFIVHATPMNLKDVDRDEIDSIMRLQHQVNHSPKSKSDFVKDIRIIWKVLFPETDEKGRIDWDLVPYPVRHLSRKVDKSREKRKKDKLSWDEFERILTYFNQDPFMQLYLMLAVESLGRPQEMLFTRIRDVETYDNYAKIWISEHGKEGTGYLQCIDSYPYLLRLLEVHPIRDDPGAFLFINLGSREFGTQMKPPNINKKLKQACRHLGISKPVTAYSLKRNGVTYRRLRGDSDLVIQHAARWTSTKQLKTYDLSSRDDSFKSELIKRGLIKDDSPSGTIPPPKNCHFCRTLNGFLEKTCTTCKRPLDRLGIVRQEQEREMELAKAKQELEQLKKSLEGKNIQNVMPSPLLQNDVLQNLVGTVQKLQLEMAAMKK